MARPKSVNVIEFWKHPMRSAELLRLAHHDVYNLRKIEIAYLRWRICEQPSPHVVPPTIAAVLEGIANNVRPYFVDGCEDGPICDHFEQLLADDERIQNLADCWKAVLRETLAGRSLPQSTATDPRPIEESIVNW